MKNTFVMLSLVVPVLSGCAGVPSGAQQAQHDHAQQAASAQQGHGPGQAAAAQQGHGAGNPHGGGMMDMKAMCDMHRHMKSGMSMAEQDAMMDKKMPGMTPEQRQQRMKMMDEQCK